MMIVNILSFFIGAYILFESIGDMARYSGPDRLCLVARDVFTGLAGMMLSGYALGGLLPAGHNLHAQLDWLHLALAAPLALYLWPKMVVRFEDLIGGMFK